MREPERKKPVLHMGHPDWWHHHGIKMRVIEKSKTRVVIEGGARLVISYAPLFEGDAPEYIVDWEVIQHVHGPEKVTGRRLFEKEELAAAFGLNLLSGDHGQWVINRYGADAAEQTLFIRHKDFLNIPCPGTRHDGDPNVSLLIYPETREAIKTLLGME